MKGNILMITPEPFFQPRGTPISVYHRTQVLGELGYKVDVVTYHVGKNVELPNTTLYRTPKIPFIKHIQIGPSYKKVIPDFFLLLKSLSLCWKKKYDFIHVHEEASIIGVLLKKLFNIPLIYDMHSSMPQQLVNYEFTRNKQIIKLFRWMEKSTIKNSSAVIAISPALKRIADKVESGKTSLIENTAIFENKSTQRDIARLKKKLRLTTEKTVVYTGTFEVNQGLEVLIAAIPAVITKEPNTKFILVGGQKEQVEDLKKKAKKLGIQDHTIILGQKTQDEINIYISLADILVSPRDKGTNTPLKIYSYLHSGKVIVATDIYSHTQVLNKAVAVLTSPNASGLAQGIITALSDPQLRAKLGKHAKIYAEMHYNRKHYVDKVDRVFTKVAEKPVYKRILVLNYEYPPIGGGGSIISKDLAEEFVRKGYKVDVVTMHYKGLKKIEEIKGVNVYRVKCYRKKKEVSTTLEMISYVFAAIPTVLRLTKKHKYDVAHTHFIIPTGILAYILKKFRGLEYVITAHGSDVPGYNPDRFVREHKVTKPLLRFIIKHSKRTISPSYFLKRLIDKSIKPKQKIQVISNGIDPQKITPGMKKKWILMTARLVQRKGFQHVLEALQTMDLKDWEVHVAGDGPHRKQLEKIAKKIDGKVVFHGWLHNGSKELVDLYKESSIFAMPSSKENSSVALLEAMSAGMPVITSNVTGCPETVGKTGFLVKVGDVEAIKNALQELMDNPSLMKRKGKEARKRVLAHYDWRKVLKQYEHTLMK